MKPQTENDDYTPPSGQRAASCPGEAPQWSQPTERSHEPQVPAGTITKLLMWPGGPDNGAHPTALPCSIIIMCDRMCGQEGQATYHILFCKPCDGMCGQEDHQTMEHILQPCSNLQAVRRDVWPRGPPDNGPHPTALPSPVISATGRVAGCYVRH